MYAIKLAGIDLYMAAVSIRGTEFTVTPTLKDAVQLSAQSAHSVVKELSLIGVRASIEMQSL